MDVVRIPVAEAKRVGGRKVDAATVQTLKESMAAIGLLSPIVVTHAIRNDGPSKVDTYCIVAGRHRVEAARSLGWTEIDAVVVDMDAQHAELCEIDENLARAELSPSQRAQAHARREELMMELGLARPRGRPGKDADSASLSYADQTAASLGVSKRTVQQDLARGKKIDPEVLSQVENTRLDTGATLDVLAATPREMQATKLAELRKPIRPAPDPLNDPEAHEKQLAALMSAWNRAAGVVREEFLLRIDQPIFDKGRAA